MPDMEVRLGIVERQQEQLEKWRDEFIRDIARQLHDLQALVTRELAGRPTWWTTFLITTLVGICVALSMHVLG